MQPMAAYRWNTNLLADDSSAQQKNIEHHPSRRVEDTNALE